MKIQKQPTFAHVSMHDTHIFYKKLNSSLITDTQFL